MCPPSESAQRAYGEYDDLELELLGTLKDIDDVHVTSSRDLVTAYVTRNVHDHARDRLTARAQTPGAWNESRGWVQRALGVDPGALQPHRLRANPSFKTSARCCTCETLDRTISRLHRVATVP
jgi:hypothetical protein